ERAGDGYVMELAIPASAETGLMPREGSKIGLRFEFRSVKGDEGLWGTVFERYSFVDVTLGAKPQLSLLKRVHRPSASTAKLGITLVTSNTGNVPVYDVSVEDVIDESAFKVLSGSTAAEYAKVAPGDSKALTYTLEALAPVADVYALPPATARYEDGAGREQETRSNGVAVHAGVAPDGRPLLVVRKTHSLGEDDRVVTGITVSNVGGGLATDIEVTGTVDGTAFALLSGSPTASYARINPSASESMTYLVRAVKPGAYVLPTASVEYRDQHGRRYVSTSRGTTIASIAAPKPPARHALYLLVVALMAIPAIVALFLLRKPVRAESQPNPPDLAWRVVERSTEAIHELRQHG
ncbi:TPA: hypothetical protein EYP44_03560, partial [Candidatus Bathyarchaeota archaeon]|nr:hypothetical protein [Candidatus Bathyarchaeota archaeon]